jgi:hypothetical protein
MLAISFNFNLVNTPLHNAKYFSLHFNNYIKACLIFTIFPSDFMLWKCSNVHKSMDRIIWKMIMEHHFSQLSKWHSWGKMKMADILFCNDIVPTWIRSFSEICFKSKELATLYKQETITQVLSHIFKFVIFKQPFSKLGQSL